MDKKEELQKTLEARKAAIAARIQALEHQLGESRASKEGAEKRAKEEEERRNREEEKVRAETARQEAQRKAEEERRKQQEEREKAAALKRAGKEKEEAEKKARGVAKRLAADEAKKKKKEEGEKRKTLRPASPKLQRGEQAPAPEERGSPRWPSGRQGIKKILGRLPPWARLAKGGRAGIRFTELFFPRQQIAGLLISQDAVRAIVLSRIKDAQPEVIIQGEVSLKEGTIQRGRLVDLAGLVAALKTLQRSAKPQSLSIPFVIVSLPVQEFWARTFRFPVSVTTPQLQEAMQLNMQLSLPFLSKEVFADWEEISSPDPEYREALLVAARQDAVEPYLAACEEAGLTVVAAELFGAGIARFASEARMALETRLFAFLIESTWYELVMEGSSILHMRAVHLNDPKGQLAQSAKLFYHFSMTEYAARNPYGAVFMGQYPEILSIEEIANQSGIAVTAFPQEAMPLPWMLAYGAALRGLIPRAHDTFVSLAPVGTEVAYTRRRALLWSELAGNFVISIVALILLVFGASFLFVLNQEKKLEARVAQQPQVPQDTETYAVQARNFNTTLVLGQGVSAIIPRWEKLFQKVREISNPGITVKRVSSDETGRLSISGVAASREALLQFKTSLENSPLAPPLSLPATALQEQANFPFSFEFIIEDSQFLYSP